MNKDKYVGKLALVNAQISFPNKSELNNELIYASYLNYFNMLNDLIDEIIADESICGSKVGILTYIMKNPVVLSSLKFISKNKKCDTLKDIDIKATDIKVFLAMLDAYVASERDSASADSLFYMLQKNLFLSKIRSEEFLSTYSDIIADIYKGSLDSSLRNICEVFANHASPSIEMSTILVELLTYLSASLELPDVYVYSKKMGLELSMLKNDYITAHNIINDLEDMHYANNDLKYYKALLKQKKGGKLSFPHKVL